MQSCHQMIKKSSDNSRLKQLQDMTTLVQACMSASPVKGQSNKNEHEWDLSLKKNAFPSRVVAAEFDGTVLEKRGQF